jgi:F420-0:gamma-glutamyl ligase
LRRFLKEALNSQKFSAFGSMLGHVGVAPRKNKRGPNDKFGPLLSLKTIVIADMI